MGKIVLTPTINAAGAKGRLTIVIRNTNNGRRVYVDVPGLENPPYKKWNMKSGKFLSSSRGAVQANTALEEAMKALQKLLDNPAYCFDEPSELKAAFERGDTACKKNKTVGEFLQLRIDEEKKKASSNYEVYQTLQKNLTGTLVKNRKKGERFIPCKYKGVKLVDVPLASVTSDHHRLLSDWIQKQKGGAGYKNLMCTFQALMNSARERGLAPNFYPMSDWRDVIKKPVNVRAMTIKEKTAVIDASITALTVEEIKKLEDMKFVSSDICVNQEELYRDTCLLMYYTKSRPVDVLSLRWGWECDENTGQISYMPHKNRNKAAGSLRLMVNAIMPPQAMRIAMKYYGKSRGGFVLPYDMNDHHWSNSMNGQEYRDWMTMIKLVEKKINRWLKKAAHSLSLSVPDLSIYDFRHSAITHAILAGENPSKVAREAGTSCAMIEKHYFSRSLKQDGEACYQFLKSARG